MAQKFYVVWVGRRTGIFLDWETARSQIYEFAGARYKAFPTRDEAERAFKAGPSTPARTGGKASTTKTPTAIDTTQFGVQIYCDGACEPNPGNAGSGMAVYRAGVVQELWYGLHNPSGTNNTAELNALYQALRYAEREIANGVTVQVLSDSAYSINGVSVWAPGWEKKGWKKSDGEIKNLDIIKMSYALYTSLVPQLTLTHVRAHVGTEGNELADRMAMHAVLTRTREFVQYEPIDVPQILRMRVG